MELNGLCCWPGSPPWGSPGLCPMLESTLHRQEAHQGSAASRHQTGCCSSSLLDCIATFVADRGCAATNHHQAASQPGYSLDFQKVNLGSPPPLPGAQPKLGAVKAGRVWAGGDVLRGGAVGHLNTHIAATTPAWHTGRARGGNAVSSRLCRPFCHCLAGTGWLEGVGGSSSSSSSSSSRPTGFGRAQPGSQVPAAAAHVS
jgi:hypothetical protein